jgi:hypothetical protein
MGYKEEFIEFMVESGVLPSAISSPKAEGKRPSS